MQVIHNRDKCWSQSILNEANWESAEMLTSFLGGVDEAMYEEHNLGSKSIYIDHIKNLIRHIEISGDVVRETKEMVAAGSIFESLSSDYLSIRNDYLKKRKKLKSQLAIINLHLR